MRSGTGKQDSMRTHLLILWARASAGECGDDELVNRDYFLPFLKLGSIRGG